jgi:hypothetical protein
MDARWNALTKPFADLQTSNVISQLIQTGAGKINDAVERFVYHSSQRPSFSNSMMIGLRTFPIVFANQYLTAPTQLTACATAYWLYKKDASPEKKQDLLSSEIKLTHAFCLAFFTSLAFDVLQDQGVGFPKTLFDATLAVGYLALASQMEAPTNLSPRKKN